jgi:hypothetical protein
MTVSSVYIVIWASNAEFLKQKKKENTMYGVTDATRRLESLCLHGRLRPSCLLANTRLQTPCAPYGRPSSSRGELGDAVHTRGTGSLWCAMSYSATSNQRTRRDVAWQERCSATSTAQHFE